jgi:hypothetical protein
MVAFSLPAYTDLWSEPLTHWLRRYSAVLCLADIPFIVWLCIRHCQDPGTQKDWIWNRGISPLSRPNVLLLFTFRNMCCHFLGNLMDSIWFRFLPKVNGGELWESLFVIISVGLLLPRAVILWFSAVLSNKWEYLYDPDNRALQGRLTYKQLKEDFMGSNLWMKCGFLFWGGFCLVGSFGLWVTLGMLSLVFGILHWLLYTIFR